MAIWPAADPEEKSRNEFTAINQYMVHSEMCDNWGYTKLHHVIEKQARDEMHHAEWLIRRIIFLEGAPVVSKLTPYIPASRCWIW
jgi:bacterioferritin